MSMSPILYGRQRRFLADGMLARLARWLRFLGFDTELRERAGLPLLRRQALLEDRLLLTRRVIAPAPWVMPLGSADWRDQLREIVSTLHISPEEFRLLERCSLCNRKLETVARDRAEGHVPESVLARHERFLLCTACSRFYWPGSHAERLERVLAELTGKAA